MSASSSTDNTGSANGSINNLNNFRNTSHSKVPSALSDLGNSRIKNNNVLMSKSKSTNSSISTDTQNTSEEKQKTNLKSENKGLFGNNKPNSFSSLGGSAGEIAADIIAKKRKLKIIALIAPMAGTALLWLIIIVLIASAVLFPIMFLGEEIEDGLAATREFGDKFTNLVSGNGFKDSSQLVPDELNSAKKKYESYKDKCLARRSYFMANNKPFSLESDEALQQRIQDMGGCIQGDFDEGILISTLQVNNTVDYSIYDTSTDENSEENTTSTSDDKYAIERNDSYDKTTVDTDEVKSFYTYADKKLLGKVDAGLLNVQDKGLMYNLIDYRFTWQCSKSGDVLNNIGEYLITTNNVLAQLASELGVDTSDPLGAIAKMLPGSTSTSPLAAIIDYIKSFKSFKDQGLDFNRFLVDQLHYSTSSPYTDKNVGLLRALWNSDSETQCGDGYVAYPVLVKYINYDNYVNYLKEVYVPTRYFNCDSCLKKEWTDEAKTQITKDTISEILDQRNAYYEQNGSSSHIYLVVDGFGNYSVEGDTGSYYGGTYPVGTAGTGWKQADPHWANIQLGSGNGTRMGAIGCYVTSIATIMANSGTHINGSTFDPGVLATTIKAHGGFDSGGSLSGTDWANSWRSLVPNFYYESKIDCSSSSSAAGNKISELLAAGKFVVVEVPHHFVAVVGADSNGIIISDPASGPATEYLSKYDGRIHDLRVFYKTD